MKILIVIGTRPNFIKVTRFKQIARSFDNLTIEIVHTGQHYDDKMANVFFEQFGLLPDHVLTLKGGTPSSQMANMIKGLSDKVTEIKPDYILVPGDVNSTLAGALVANREGIRLGHLESGLRSYDRGMPEEVNRILVDQMAHDYFVTEESGLRNLNKEGLSEKSLETTTSLVGNTMIDTLVEYDGQIRDSDILKLHRLEEKNYILMTMHRPATVDNAQGLQFLLDVLEKATTNHTVVLPMHPRTQNQIKAFGLTSKFASLKRLMILDPLGYFAFQRLVLGATAILTDSGGIQEESTFRQIPCVTLRPNTERPITCDLGTNQLVGLDQDAILSALEHPKHGQIPPLWDGKSTERVIEHLLSL